MRGVRLAVRCRRSVAPDGPVLKRRTHLLMDQLGYGSLRVHMFAHGSRDMRLLNAMAQGADKPTDVLSFQYQRVGDTTMNTDVHYSIPSHCMVAGGNQV